MKKISLLVICLLLLGVGICSCTPDNSNKFNAKQSSKQSQRVDYSNNPYVGLVGSSYRIERGTTNDYAIMMFWFYADGSGAWGYNRNGAKKFTIFTILFLDR